MSERKYRYAEIGMLFGLFVGGGLAIILFATTGNAVYFAVVGVGLAVGLILSAGYDQSKRQEQEGHK